MAATALPGTLLAPNNMEVSDSTTTAQAICAVDAGNYAWVSVHITAQGGSSTVTFQVCNDNATWVNLNLYSAGATGAGTPSSTGGTGVFHGPLPGRYFRLNVTGISSGTTSAIVELTVAPRVLPSLSVLASPSTATAFDLNSAATTNATSVKAGAGTLYGATFTNVTAAAKFVKVYNKASAPTVGTDVPVATYSLGVSSGAITLMFGALGMRFTAGIALAITGALAIADATAVAAGDVQVHLDYV